MEHEPLRYAHEEGHTDVCFSTDGSKFITCGADGDIRVWSTEEGDDPTHNCIGEWSLSVREKGGNLYIASANNDVQILTFPNCERNGVLDRFVATINQIAVSRNSEHIAVAGEDMEIKVYNVGNDDKTAITFDGLSGPALSVAINANFVAAGSGDGKLRIWEISSKELKKEIECFPKVNSFVNAEVLCRLDFSPDDKMLAYPHNDKIVLLDTNNWSEMDVLKNPEICDPYSILQFSPCGKFLAATTSKGDFVIYHISIRSIRKRSKHPNNLAICGLVWNPTGKDQIVYTDVQGQLGIATECIAIKSTDDDLFTENELDFGDVQFETDDEDNENAVSVEKLKKEVMGEVEEPELNFERSSGAPTPRPRTPQTPQQDAFMPSSTPEHLNPRYLCWNGIGIVRSYGDDESNKSIEIEFHNATFHNSMMLQNYQDYHLGTVSTSAVAVANSKQLYVIPLSATSKEWILKLDDSPEDILLVTVSENLVAFATSCYQLRICSIFGTQRAIVSIPGPLVSIASYQNSLLVAYHFAGVRKNDQCINIKLIQMEGFAMTSSDICCPLAPESILGWLGFTDMGNPAIMDSTGVLLIYPVKSKSWIPFCDTSKHLNNQSDGFFLTSIMESHQTLFGIKCRGGSYPALTPTPTVSELKLEPPFVEPSTDKTQLEMNLFTWSNLQMTENEKKFSETGLKAFALACKNNLDQRAVELMEIIENGQLVNLAAKYATKINKKLVAEKLLELAGKLMDDSHDFVSTPNHSIVLNRRPLLSSIKRQKKNLMPTVVPPTSLNATQETNSSILDDSSIVEDEPMPKNPFVKNSKSDSSNPLSLLNKYAGVDYTDTKENKRTDGEKRKQPDSDLEVSTREKQRKLDKYMFKKQA